jgi:hypothetical protein
MRFYETLTYLFGERWKIINVNKMQIPLLHFTGKWLIAISISLNWKSTSQMHQQLLYEANLKKI